MKTLPYIVCSCTLLLTSCVYRAVETRKITIAENGGVHKIPDTIFVDWLQQMYPAPVTQRYELALDQNHSAVAKLPRTETLLCFPNDNHPRSEYIKLTKEAIVDGGTFDVYEIDNTGKRTNKTKMKVIIEKINEPPISQNFLRQ